MLCRLHEHFSEAPSGERIFEVEAPRIRYGPGALGEVGSAASDLDVKRVALFTDPRVRTYAFFAEAQASLAAANIDAVVYDAVAVEPTDASLADAIAFARDGRFDGYVSIGGGSTIDTAKIANLYATYPDTFSAYVNAPVGQGKAVPGPLRPHIACPTTSGTGSECTGVAIFDYLEFHAKTGIASRRLRPSLAVIDPDTTATLPAEVVAASGFDVLSHALESLTARPFTQRAKPANPSLRPLSQGANPYSDIACVEALHIISEYFVRAVADAHDGAARERMMFASTLAGIGFGNAGVHLPHGMAYAVAGLVRDFRPPGYPQEAAIVPHGMSVILNAPAVFRALAPTCPERHLAAAAALGARTDGASADDAGDVLASRIIELMQATGMPNGLSGVGYAESDIDALTDGGFLQQRLLQNAPGDIDRQMLGELYTKALAYW